MQNITYPILLMESDVAFPVTDVFLLQTSQIGLIRTMIYKTSHHHFFLLVLTSHIILCGPAQGSLKPWLEPLSV